MNRTRFFPFLALILVLLVSACSRTPENLTMPSLEPQFGTAADDQATDVAVQKRFGDVYVSGHLGNRVFLRQYKRDGTLNWQRLNAARTGYVARVIASAVDGSGNSYLAWNYYLEDNGYVHSPATDGPFITKRDRNGTLIWNKSFSNLRNMEVDSGGNLYLVGSNSVRKHTPNGTLVWERQPSNRGASMTAIALSPAGNVVALSDNGMIVKYNNQGRQLLRTARNFRGYDLSVTFGPQEEIFVSETISFEDASENAVGVLKFDVAGNFQWNDFVVTFSSFSSSSFARAKTGVAVDSEGNAYLTGSYICEIFGTLGCGARDTQYSYTDALVRKYTPDGTITWTRRFGTSRFDTGSSVALFSDNELYVSGYTEGFLAEPNRGGTDAFLRKMNGSGARIWTR